MYDGVWWMLCCRNVGGGCNVVWIWFVWLNGECYSGLVGWDCCVEIWRWWVDVDWLCWLDFYCYEFVRCVIICGIFVFFLLLLIWFWWFVWWKLWGYFNWWLCRCWYGWRCCLLCCFFCGYCMVFILICWVRFFVCGFFVFLMCLI